LPVFAVAAYFASQGAFSAMIAGWLWPLHHYTAVNQLPFGYVYMGRALIDALTPSSALERAIIALVFSAMIIISLIPILVMGMAGVETFRAMGRRDGAPSALSQFVILAGA